MKAYKGIKSVKGSKRPEHSKFMKNLYKMGDFSPWKGRHHSKENKKKISIANKGKFRITDKGREILSKKRTGKNNPMWKGGGCQIF